MLEMDKKSFENQFQYCIFKYEPVVLNFTDQIKWMFDEFQRENSIWHS